MSYPFAFHRLVLIGNQFGDVFNTTLSIAKTGAAGDISPVSAPLLAAVAAYVGAWWDDAHGGGALPGQAKLTGIKLNLIGTDGKYVTNYTNEHVYATPIAGGGAAAAQPPQLSTVVTLRTSAERGTASKGRMYLPATLGYAQLGSDGRATVAQATGIATGVKTLINGLNTIYQSGGHIATTGVVSVMSNVGTGQCRTVIRTSAGRVTDTMRSRRSSLVEDPQYVDLV